MHRKKIRKYADVQNRFKIRGREFRNRFSTKFYKKRNFLNVFTYLIFRQLCQLTSKEKYKNKQISIFMVNVAYFCIQTKENLNIN